VEVAEEEVEVEAAVQAADPHHSPAAIDLTRLTLHVRMSPSLLK
jgi:hypothetical protein